MVDDCRWVNDSVYSVHLLSTWHIVFCTTDIWHHDLHWYTCIHLYLYTDIHIYLFVTYTLALLLTLPNPDRNSPSIFISPFCFLCLFLLLLRFFFFFIFYLHFHCFDFRVGYCITRVLIRQLATILLRKRDYFFNLLSRCSTIQSVSLSFLLPYFFLSV